VTLPSRLRFLPVLTLIAVALSSVASAAPPAAASSAAAPSAAKPDSAMASARADTTHGVPAWKPFPGPDSTLVSKLRSGGYVLVFRHSITDWGQRDSDVENFEDRSQQRNLSKEGVEVATAIGKAIAALKIPIGPVITSPMWRCRDTGQLAFGKNEPNPDLFRRGATSRAARLAMLSTAPEPGKNIVLVTHQDVLLPIVPGLHRDQLKEAEAFVVKPLGNGKFEVLAQVTPADWEALASSNKP
jgi:phosphohistidine phosphatase SixA